MKGLRCDRAETREDSAGAHRTLDEREPSGALRGTCLDATLLPQRTRRVAAPWKRPARAVSTERGEREPAGSHNPESGHHGEAPDPLHRSGSGGEELPASERFGPERHRRSNAGALRVSAGSLRCERSRRGRRAHRRRAARTRPRQQTLRDPTSRVSEAIPRAERPEDPAELDRDAASRARPTDPTTGLSAVSTGRRSRQARERRRRGSASTPRCAARARCPRAREISRSAASEAKRHRAALQSWPLAQPFAESLSVRRAARERPKSSDDREAVERPRPPRASRRFGGAANKRVAREPGPASSRREAGRGAKTSPVAKSSKRHHHGPRERFGERDARSRHAARAPR